MSNFSISQMNGNKTSSCVSASTNSLRFGTENPIDINWVIDDRKHRSFGGLCVGRSDELYVVFRAGYGHGVDDKNIGGDLYYSVSYDYGNTWEEPTLFKSAPSGRDYRDVLLTYDNLFDQYFLTYTDASIDYTSGNRVFHILVSDIGGEPFANMKDVTPTMPFTFLNQTFTKPIRIGTNIYLPVYGKDNASDLCNVAIIKATVGYISTDWTVLKKFTDENMNDNECCLYLTWNQEKKLYRMNLLIRRGDEGYLTYSDDYGVTWTDKTCIGFDVAGGVNVFNLDGTLMLFGRNQELGDRNCICYVAYSDESDGQNWSNRSVIADCGPGYPTLVRFKNGKTLLSYCKEYWYMGHMYIREINSVPNLSN